MIWHWEKAFWEPWGFVFFFPCGKQRFICRATARLFLSTCHRCNKSMQMRRNTLNQDSHTLSGLMRSTADVLTVTLMTHGLLKITSLWLWFIIYERVCVIMTSNLPRPHLSLISHTDQRDQTATNVRNTTEIRMSFTDSAWDDVNRIFMKCYINNIQIQFKVKNQHKIKIFCFVS